MLLEPGEVTNKGLVGGLLTVNRDLFSRVSLVVTCKINVDYIIILRYFTLLILNDNFTVNIKKCFAKRKRE